MTYICNEPETTQAYRDQNGALHNTRDDAIDRNFELDLMKSCVDVLENSRIENERRNLIFRPGKDRFAHIPVNVIPHFVRAFVETNPDIVRVLLGDRDATG